jgi:hypothetical protein
MSEKTAGVGLSFTEAEFCPPKQRSVFLGETSLEVHFGVALPPLTGPFRSCEDHETDWARRGSVRPWALLGPAHSTPSAAPSVRSIRPRHSGISSTESSFGPFWADRNGPQAVHRCRCTTTSVPTLRSDSAVTPSFSVGSAGICLGTI